ncbi:hypothetical protein AOT20_02455 [Klebsiella pneumoniae]|nr:MULTISPECIES: hypothetical protein [Klebsiella]ESM13291.1 hypothetical protein L415_03161 [Klebsiella pneumoniae UCICRE 4]KMB12270.1 hypothetical protein SL52_03167 [Klebsiella pneumoniae]KUF68640.1 hypothetical protein AOT20_02455 [Klebsiella pneumoniae]MCM5951112.1 hypothetical protein [Klebsiella pneumoniae]MDE1616538.1 hypothetical protein [Klebsiella pneumoniae]
MNEEVTLTVFKNSPHIWAGGLEGEDLAKWLMGRANAIMFAEAQKLKLSEVKGLLIELCSPQCLRDAYAVLGLSQSASDPIHPLSTEAIQFDKALGCGFHKPSHLSLNLVTPVLPVGFALLSDLREVQEEYQRMKAALSESASIQFEQKASD